MKLEEASKLKPGDLVILDNRNKFYGGMVLEIESIKPKEEPWCYRITLKQAGYDGGFRLRDYDSRHLKRYEEA